MSVSTEIDRINGGKTAAVNSIKNKGVAVPDDAKIDDLSVLIDDIGTVIQLETLAVAPMTNTEINANLVAGAFVKVANNHVTMSDLANGATVNGSTIPSSDFYELFEGVISTQQMQFISVLPVAVGKDLDGIVFNESGTYVLAQACQSGIEITIPNFKFIRNLDVVERGTTTLTSRRNTSNNTIVLTAENNQKTGYAVGGKSTATKTISLSVSGNTATATDGSISISVDVPTTIETCTVDINIVDSVGYIGVTATQFADGEISIFSQSKSSGSFSIPNVVCGSIITIICNGYFSISSSMTKGAVGSSSQYLKTPSAAGTYSANIIAYDD